MAKAELDSKTVNWGKKMETKEGELNEMRNKIVNLQQELLQIKKDGIKREAREANNVKEIEMLKGELEVLKQSAKNKKGYEK